MARDIKIVHAEVRAAYTSPYGFVSKTLQEANQWEMKLVRGQFLEVRRPGWAGAVHIPYENIRGMTAAPDRAGVNHRGETLDETGRVIIDSRGHPVKPAPVTGEPTDAMAELAALANK